MEKIGSQFVNQNPQAGVPSKTETKEPNRLSFNALSRPHLQPHEVKTSLGERSFINLTPYITEHHSPLQDENFVDDSPSLTESVVSSGNFRDVSLGEADEFVEVQLDENKAADRLQQREPDAEKPFNWTKVKDSFVEAAKTLPMYVVASFVCELVKSVFTKVKLSEIFDTRPFTWGEVSRGERELSMVGLVSTSVHHVKKILKKEA